MPSAIILKIKNNKISERDLKIVIKIIRDGGLVVFPTETVYGIGADALNRTAITKIYKLKGRSRNKPLQILAADSDMAWPLVSVSASGDTGKLARAFWPGPLTMVLPTSTLGKLVTGGRENIGIRVPKYPVLQKIIAKYGKPLAATSANMSSQTAITSGFSAKKHFCGKVGCIIDGGKAKLGKESTVISMMSFPPQILREGAISKKQVAALLGLS